MQWPDSMARFGECMFWADSKTVVERCALTFKHVSYVKQSEVNHAQRSSPCNLSTSNKQITNFSLNFVINFESDGNPLETTIGVVVVRFVCVLRSDDISYLGQVMRQHYAHVRTAAEAEIGALERYVASVLCICLCC